MPNNLLYKITPSPAKKALNPLGNKSKILKWGSPFNHLVAGGTVSLTDQEARAFEAQLRVANTDFLLESSTGRVYTLGYNRLGRALCLVTEKMADSARSFIPRAPSAGRRAARSGRPKDKHSEQGS